MIMHVRSGVDTPTNNAPLTLHRTGMDTSLNSGPILRIEVLRLSPGDDLRNALQAWCRTHDVPAACVLSAVGSFTQAVLRYAEASQGSHVAGPLELMTLAGTLGRGGLHLHASVSDAAGQMRGGHLMPGCTVRTTAEIVLGVLPELVFAREPDPATGYLELAVQRKSQG